MGLLRLWWVPAGMRPDQGTYVRYDHQAMVGVLTGQAAAAGALAIGEDLGTVDPWIRDYLAGQGVLGTSMLWFERGPDGTPLPPGKWRRNCLAMVGTHDVPPVAAFVTGEQVELRSRLGLLTRSYQAERAEAERAVAAWQDALAAEGLLTAGTQAQPGRVHPGLLRVPGPHPGPAARRLAGRRGGRPAAAEHARDHDRVPELADPAVRRRRACGIPRRPGRLPGRARGSPGCDRQPADDQRDAACAAAGRLTIRAADDQAADGQPACRSTCWQRSARRTLSWPSVSRRRSAAGGLARSMYSSVSRTVRSLIWVTG